MRIGIHRGPVVAGVVGSKKFSFDLWGDTVNVAHRLASFGAEPAVHLTADAWRRIEGRTPGSSLCRFGLKGRGAIEVFRCGAPTG